MDIEFNAELASGADKAADRIVDGGAYIGVITKASAITAKSGTTGVAIEFHVPGQGNAEFSLYTLKEDGKTPVFGMSMLQSIMFFTGLKRLKAVPGKVSVYDEDAKARIEVDGEVYPELYGKPFGVVLQQEIYGPKGATRLNLYGTFQPETRLTFTEIQERATKPVKLARLLAGLKVKDSRKPIAGGGEPAQPPMGSIGEGF